MFGWSGKTSSLCSRSLTGTERKYSPIDREALALYWGVQKFYQYLYGRTFVLVTDHQPLLTIFGPKKGIPQMCASRLQRYAFFLAGFNYTIEYVKSERNCADALSRVPVGEVWEGEIELSYLGYVQEAKLPVTNTEIKKETRVDSLLSKVILYVESGWPGALLPEEQELKPFFRRRWELTVDQGILMWGYRVIIPAKFRKMLLTELHESHFGIVKMKAAARSYLWWPGLDSEIQGLVDNCRYCARERAEPGKGVLHSWPYPDKPFRRVHVDFLGPFYGKIFLLVTDAYSKWLEAFQVANTSAEQVVLKLRRMFSQFGKPHQLVSDNGPPFTSREFRMFLKLNGVEHVLTPPYHPATNGLSENHVRTFKNKIKITIAEGGSFDKAVDTFLFAYRTMPHCTTGETPAKLFLGRQVRTRLEMLRPDLPGKVEKEQQRQRVNYGGKNKKSFEVGDKVLIRNYRLKGPKWISGTIHKVLGPVTYDVNIGGAVWKRHIDQMWEDKGNMTDSIAADDNIEVNGEIDNVWNELPGVETIERELSGETREKEVGTESVRNEGPRELSKDSTGPVVEVESKPQGERRYPLRVRKPKDIWDA